MENDIFKKIESSCIQKLLPDGTTYQSISVEQIERLAHHFGLNGKHIEIKALEKGIVPERYVRNLKTFSAQDQATLLQSTVSIVGLGGLGGAVTEILARLGIGTLNLIDGDCFEDSNFNRQFLSTHTHLVTHKTEAAAYRVQAINSSINVNKHAAYLDEKNAGRTLQNSDVVVDCLDSVHIRFLLEGASKKLNIPLVSAAVGGLSGHVTTIFPEDPGLTLIYGNPNHLPPKGAETSLGCLSPAVTLLASVQTSEVVKILLKKGSILRNKLLVVDLMDNTIEVLDLL